MFGTSGRWLSHRRISRRLVSLLSKASSLGFLSHRHGTLCHRRGRHVSSCRCLFRPRGRLSWSLTRLSGDTSLKDRPACCASFALNLSTPLSSLVRILGRATLVEPFCPQRSETRASVTIDLPFFQKGEMVLSAYLLSPPSPNSYGWRLVSSYVGWLATGIILIPSPPTALAPKECAYRPLSLVKLLFSV